MRQAILLLFCVTALASRAQVSPTIKKLKITELEAYISRCDHPLIVNFWATFCVPCVKEIPYFQSTVNNYRDKGVELLLVSLDLPDYYPARIAAFAKKNNYKAGLAWLNETDADYFCPRIDKRWSGGIPASLFINNKTHYRQFFDRQLTEGQVEPAIKAMLTPAPYPREIEQPTERVSFTVTSLPAFISSMAARR